MTEPNRLLNRVLVVEDNPDIAMLICAFLEAEGGFRADHAEDAPAALEICRRHPYDLLIVDHFIPGMDGIQLLAALRESYGNTPAIIMSGNPAIADSVEGRGTAFLAKPFQMSRLVEEATKTLRATTGGRAAWPAG
jgi:DNA-binding response OmpR family regulator